MQPAAVPAVDVYLCDMGSHDSSRGHSQIQILTADERDRAARFRFDSDRRMYIACRSTLRSLLADHLGRRPADLRFDYGAQGKPALIGEDISFNVSHAGYWFACAISSGGPVGVDIEHIHRLDDMMPMARHFFAPAEVAHLDSIPETERTRSFFECWTRKEAVIKTTGEGVSRPLDSFEVAFGPHTEPALLRFDDQLHPGWPMRSFTPASDYVAALTTRDPKIEVRLKILQM